MPRYAYRAEVQQYRNQQQHKLLWVSRQISSRMIVLLVYRNSISFDCNFYTHLKLFRSCRMLQFEVNVIKKNAIILYDFVSTAFYSYTLYHQGSHSCLPRFILVFEFRNSQKVAMFLSEILQISKISLNFMKFPKRFVDVEISEH